MGGRAARPTCVSRTMRSHGVPMGTTGGERIICNSIPSARRARRTTMTGAAASGSATATTTSRRVEFPVTTSASMTANSTVAAQMPRQVWTQAAGAHRASLVVRIPAAVCTQQAARPRVELWRSRLFSCQVDRRPPSLGPGWAPGAKDRVTISRDPVPDRSLPGRRTIRWPSAGSTASCTSLGTT